MKEGKGHLILIMAPMASGKGTLIDYISHTFPQITRLVSCTTRAKRPQETEGVDYYFLTRTEFEGKVAEDAFTEWAEFGGNLYGTLRTELETRMNRGEVVLNEIDLQGVTQLMRLIDPKDRTVIYIEGGAWETLCVRAQKRAPITEEELALRYTRYCEEKIFKPNVDFVIDNSDGRIESAKQELRAIIERIINNVASHTHGE